jgi:hypothetical protein
MSDDADLNPQQSVADAMAEVGVMENPRNNNRAAQVVADLEATDESGDLVRQRFLQFLND